ncbi:flagellar motor switch protein FliG [Schlesneria sp.]|uniref:flagellar motor switch protein FliG n=1 Tax=Schlesneria sp. TaxID=2762018 RepID=UPI002F0FAB4C
MNHESLDGTQKTAILLLSLDQAMAADLLGRLPRDQVERIALAIANAGTVTREQQEAVLSEFKTAFESRPLMQPAGSETARELLERSIDQNEIEPIQERLEERVHAGPFAFLHSRHPDDIRKLIETEHPQAIAVIATKLPSLLASQVLAGLEPSLRVDVLGRMARLGPTDAELLDEIAFILKVRIGQAPLRLGGISAAAAILRESPPAVSRDLLQSLDQKDTGLAGSLRESMFAFTDIIDIEDDSLGIILHETKSCSWALALKGCSDKLRQRVVRALPAPQGKGLARDIQSLGPLRLSEITAAQQEILRSIHALAAEGDIVLPSKVAATEKSSIRTRKPLKQ